MDRTRGERPDPRGGELDRERKLVDCIADRIHVLVGLKAGLHSRGALDEERMAVADRHRRHLPYALGLKTEPLTTRRDHDDVRTAGHELADEVCHSRYEVLAVVDHEQRPLGAELGDDRRSNLDAGPIADLQRLGKCGSDIVLVSDRCERDPVDAIRKAIGGFGGGLEGESRLSGSSRPGERDEPRIIAIEQFDNLPELALATEKGGRGSRKIAPMEALQGWELAVAELVHALGCAQVLEAVLAEVRQLLVSDERARSPLTRAPALRAPPPQSWRRDGRRSRHTPRR